MKVLDNSGIELNAEVSIENIDGNHGLVIDSRGGAKGKPNERNTDYSLAVELLLGRLEKVGKKKLEVFLVSRTALNRAKTSSERLLNFNGVSALRLASGTPEELRKKIGHEVQAMFREPTAGGGGNRNKRIQLVLKLNYAKWVEVVTGRAQVKPITDAELETEETEFDPTDSTDGRRKVMRSITARRGQTKFRKELLKAYANCCAVTGSKITEILEAAHIIPYNGEKTNHVTNGILLRTDIHTLFDLGLLGITPNYKIKINSNLSSTEYWEFDGRDIKLPINKSKEPSKKALDMRVLPD